jgi:hypothetical protein
LARVLQIEPLVIDAIRGGYCYVFSYLKKDLTAF